MASSTYGKLIILLLITGILISTEELRAQIGDGTRRYIVEDGLLKEIGGINMPDENSIDSLFQITGTYRTMASSFIARADSLAADSLQAAVADSLRDQARLYVSRADSIENSIGQLYTTSVGAASLNPDAIPPDSVPAKLSRRQLRRQRYADPEFVPHSKIFKDSIPLSRMTWISIAAPGFSQLYNREAWKIPILYTTVGTSLYFGIREHKEYRKWRKEETQIKWDNSGNPNLQSLLDPVQKKMIRHNTRRQLLFGAAAVSYMYFLGDGVLNYDGYATNVKKATTLSTLLPGAGQIYNRSYWRVPFVVGAFATFAYMVDWNNRGYKRFKLAYDMVTDDDPLTVDEFNGRYPANFLKNLKNSYRRNRDLCIILMGITYALNIIDAHVDAHMKSYDVSDDLSVSVEPAMTYFHTRRSGTNNLIGFNLKISF